MTDMTGLTDMIDEFVGLMEVLELTEDFPPSPSKLRVRVTPIALEPLKSSLQKIFGL